MDPTVFAGLINWLLFIVIIFVLISYALFFAVSYKGGKMSREKTLSSGEWAPYRGTVEKELQWYDAQDKEQLFILTKDRIRLSAFYIKAEGESRGRVVLMHDYRTPAEVNFAGVVRAYHEGGFDVLLCDERAHGESLGKYICFGARERFDCKLWIECLNKVYGGDKPTLLHGVGMGGTAVLMTAGLKLPYNVCGVIADSAFTSPYAVVKKLLKNRHMSLNLGFFDFWCKGMAGYKLKGSSTQAALRNSKLPVLLLHGEADSFAPVAMAQANYDAATGEKKIILVPGAGHGVPLWAADENGSRELLSFVGHHLQLPEKPEEQAKTDESGKPDANAEVPETGDAAAEKTE